MPPRRRGSIRRGGSSGQGPSRVPSPNPYEGSGDSSSSWRTLENLSREYSPPHSNSQNSYYSYHSHQSHHSEHSNHQQEAFDPNHYLQSPSITPPVDSSTHMEEDPGMPPLGSQDYPIELSSGPPSRTGSPFEGPDSWDLRWSQYQFYYTPSPHSSKPPTPPHEAMEVEQQQQPPPPPSPSRRKRGARMSVRAGQWSGSQPPMPQTYPTIHEDPQMGGPSHTSPVAELPPLPPAIEPTVQLSMPNPGNPIPTYPDTSGYHYAQAPLHYDYSAPSVDPYLEAIAYNAYNPSPFLPYSAATYPGYGYPYPSTPQHQPQPPPPPPEPQPAPQIEAINQALDRVEQLQRRSEKKEKKTFQAFKKLAKIWKKDE